MEMTLPITLIVKAPNQQIEDQTVECELSWTIHKLKGHLSEVYPSKPARNEQKVIYSGQLLSDSVVLKDVLRNYDEQNTHTVHLVCTPSRNYKFESKKVMKTKPEMEHSAQSTVSDASSLPTTSSGIRHRPGHGHRTQDTMTMTDFQTRWTTFAQPQANVMDPNQFAMQFALFQQAYAQYINQYMQMVNQVPLQRQTEVQAEPELAPDPVAEAAPAADDADGDEVQADRDWLDWFYVFSRVLVLFCIVYFYSSPLRFAFVLLLGVGLYLYQMGFFRVQAVNNNEARRPENNNVPPGNNQVPPVNQEQRPTMLNIMWTFFTTFFASLIPEMPNAV